jgi:hypothetical protein
MWRKIKQGKVEKDCQGISFAILLMVSENFLDNSRFYVETGKEAKE